MTDLEILRPSCAPIPIGPYSPMTRAGNMIWGSALAGVNPIWVCSPFTKLYNQVVVDITRTKTVSTLTWCAKILDALGETEAADKTRWCIVLAECDATSEADSTVEGR